MTLQNLNTYMTACKKTKSNKQKKRNTKKIIQQTSSNVKSTPPIGAPKATETPAAAAADKTSRFFASFLPYFGNK